jgi:hypothetical protein
MKFIVILGDGMADRPIESLEGKTPLQAAHTPNMDLLARGGKNGLAITVPKDMPPGSDVANLSVMGYDPRKYYKAGPSGSGGHGRESGGGRYSLQVQLRHGSKRHHEGLQRRPHHERRGKRAHQGASASHARTEALCRGELSQSASPQGGSRCRLYPPTTSPTAP